MARLTEWYKAVVLNLWVGRGPLPGGPRPRLGIETFFLCESCVTILEKVPSSGLGASDTYVRK